jgi:hypothetical protein
MNTTTRQMAWDHDWVWSLPLIIGTLVFHVIALGCLAEIGERTLAMLRPTRSVIAIFAIAMGLTTLVTTLLIALEAAIWAITYRFLGASPDIPNAMLYSLSAITSYGHASVYLEARWQMMGALEAVNGVLLFGLTTAFLFAVLQRVWPWRHDRR